MFSMPEMPSSASKLLSVYASLAGTMMLVRSMANELIPIQLRCYLYSKVNNFLFTPLSSNLTLIIDEKFGIARSQVYDAAETYLRTKISPSAERLRVGKTRRQKNITVSIERGQEIVDSFDGIQLKWRFVCTEPKERSEKRCYELTFNKKFKDKVLETYLPCILAAAKEIKQKDKVVKLYTRDNIPSQDDDGGCRGGWGSIDFEHPSTFHTLAIDSELKKTIIADLERFVKRREFYKKVGKAWKRGYLLYGPPGTGKSSLIAAMANYLKFDVYDLELSRLYSNAAFRSVLLSTTNRSILVIEDIDCSADIEDLEHGDEIKPSTSKITLSGLLNFIDGLWSSCGDERIIIFTTNHKDRLDPALLRPGRMDVHIHMSYCSPQGFKILASNYLGIHGNNHMLCGEIEGMIETTEVTPAEVAEELMKSDDPDEALGGLVNFLKRKSQGKDDEVDRKRMKIENNEVAVGNIMERGDPEAGELTSVQ